MSAAVATATSTGELLAALRELCSRLPVPQPSWHRYVSQIAACRTEFEHAIALASESPAVVELAAELVEGYVEMTFEPDGTPPALTAAWDRLEALPMPSGQHPYLDDILPALEAYRLLLIALSRSASVA